MSQCVGMTLGNVEPGSLRCFAEPLMKESTADGQAEKVADLEHAFVARTLGHQSARMALQSKPLQNENPSRSRGKKRSNSIRKIFQQVKSVARSNCTKTTSYPVLTEIDL